MFDIGAVLMKTDFDIFANKDLFAPVVFRSQFNNFESVSVDRAWSLFFTAGTEDKALGFRSELGWFFSNFLVATGVSGILWALFLQ